MPVFQSQLLAHVQKAGSCDLILNKWALGNGELGNRVVEKVDSVISVNAMYGICTKQVNHSLMADLLQICNRSVTDMLHTSNSSVAVSNTDL